MSLFVMRLTPLLSSPSWSHTHSTCFSVIAHMLASKSICCFLAWCYIDLCFLALWCTRSNSFVQCPELPGFFSAWRHRAPWRLRCGRSKGTWTEGTSRTSEVLLCSLRSSFRYFIVLFGLVLVFWYKDLLWNPGWFWQDTLASDFQSAFFFFSRFSPTMSKLNFWSFNVYEYSIHLSDF